MNDKYIGIILKQIEYKENDSIINVLLEGLGKYSFSCKGTKKLTSKNAMSIRPFLTSEFLFDYNETKTIFNLKNATTIKSRKNINSNLIKMSLSSLICQMVDLTTYNDDTATINYVYELLDFTLDKLNEDNHDILITCLFIAVYLEIIGIKPNIESCALCSNKEIIGISIKEGGFICKNCANNTALYDDVNIENLKKFRLINKAKLINYEILKELDTYDIKDLDILVKFFEFHIGLKLKSYEFLKELL